MAQGLDKEEEVKGLLEKPKAKFLRLKLQSKPYVFHSVCAFVGIISLTIFGYNAGFMTEEMRTSNRATVIPLAESVAYEDLVGKKLEYVHITETGGDIITWAGFNSRGFLWGECHFISQPAIGCSNPDITDYKGISPWHQTPARLEDNANPYKNANLFTVVRNPYSRIIAEYYNPWVGNSADDRNDKDVMNAFLQDKIIGNDRPFSLQLHFIPQSEYVFDENGNQVIHHVLHYENMDEDFKILMDSFGLDIPLDWSLTSQVDVTNERLNPQDLDDKTIKLINKYAKDDFILFGYKMVNYGDQIES